MNRTVTSAPTLSVGILSAPSIRFCLDGRYHVLPDGPLPDALKSGDLASGEREAVLMGDSILFQGRRLHAISFIPVDSGSSFLIRDVTIGKDFHWQRQEAQRFPGQLRLIIEDGQITAVNILPLEEYLECVISSEMSITAPLEFLKAHAVISRSWLLAQKEDRSGLAETWEREIPGGYERWYNHTSHRHFDVCADDHCQRYQGLSRKTGERAREAVLATFGQVLTYEGRICDARYSKCCGGVTELFSTGWEDMDYGYLRSVRDSKTPQRTPDLRDEKEARQWILSRPDSFCAARDREILASVLNHYDQETGDFYRWEQEYTQAELSGIIQARTGTDIGQVLELKALKRGPSGRIRLLRIMGTRSSLTVGKELEIRKVLSRSHLLSSAFSVDRLERDGQTIFRLRGAGWGHGVGLCQVGAAVMATKGLSYERILEHYYPGALLTRLYQE